MVFLLGFYCWGVFSKQRKSQRCKQKSRPGTLWPRKKNLSTSANGKSHYSGKASDKSLLKSWASIANCRGPFAEGSSTTADNTLGKRQKGGRKKARLAHSYYRKQMHAGCIKKTLKNWHFSNKPVYFNDAIWKKDQINKAAGQKWRYGGSNRMCINCQNLGKMLNYWPSKMMEKFNPSNQVSWTESVWFVARQQTLCTFFKNRHRWSDAYWASKRAFHFPSWEKAVRTVPKPLFTLCFSLLTKASPPELVISLVIIIVTSALLKAYRGRSALVCTWSKLGGSWDIASWNWGQKKHEMNMH